NCDGAPVDSELASLMRCGGVEVREEQFPEFRWLAEYSPECTDTVVEWMRRGQRSMTLAIDEYCGWTQIDLQDAQETALFFRASCPLFGVVCKPDEGQPDTPTLVFINVAAGIRHIG